MNHKFLTTTGSFDLEAEVKQIGSDLLVMVWGGEIPHIGAVSCSQPRPSLSDPHKISSTTSVFCFLGHKEDDLAKHMGELISKTLNVKVVTSVGIHWNNITMDQIKRIEKNMDQLTNEILRYFIKQDGQ